MATELADLVARLGTYGGHGINHADQPFHGELTLRPLPGGAGVELELRATGIDGTEYGVERGWVAPDERGLLALWTVSAGAPWVDRLELRRSFPRDGAERELVFASEEPDGGARSETRVSLWGDGSLGYRQRRAEPGSDWVTQAEVRCRPVAVTPWHEDRSG